MEELKQLRELLLNATISSHPEIVFGPCDVLGPHILIQTEDRHTLFDLLEKIVSDTENNGG